MKRARREFYGSADQLGRWGFALLTLSVVLCAGRVHAQADGVIEPASWERSGPVGAPADKAEDMGPRSFLVQQAVKLVASAIRLWSDDADKVTKDLDSDSKKALKRHAIKIADKLSLIALTPDLAVHIVKKQIIDYMRMELKISPGIAQLIGEGIAGALWSYL